MGDSGRRAVFLSGCGRAGRFLKLRRQICANEDCLFRRCRRHRLQRVVTVDSRIRPGTALSNCSIRAAGFFATKESLNYSPATLRHSAPAIAGSRADDLDNEF